PFVFTKRDIAAGAVHRTGRAKHETFYAEFPTELQEVSSSANVHVLIQPRIEQGRAHAGASCQMNHTFGSDVLKSFAHGLDITDIDVKKSEIAQRPDVGEVSMLPL